MGEGSETWRQRSLVAAVGVRARPDAAFAPVNPMASSRTIIPNPPYPIKGEGFRSCILSRHPRGGGGPACLSPAQQKRDSRVRGNDEGLWRKSHSPPDEPTRAIDELRKILKSVHMGESLLPLERFSKTATRFPPVTWSNHRLHPSVTNATKNPRSNAPGTRVFCGLPNV
jgi:hypothetical protein